LVCCFFTIEFITSNTTKLNNNEKVNEYHSNA
jgi:hypothetical protein